LMKTEQTKTDIKTDAKAELARTKSTTAAVLQSNTTKQQASNIPKPLPVRPAPTTKANNEASTKNFDSRPSKHEDEPKQAQPKAAETKIADSKAAVKVDVRDLPKPKTLPPLAKKESTSRSTTAASAKQGDFTQGVEDAEH